MTQRLNWKRVAPITAVTLVAIGMAWYVVAPSAGPASPGLLQAGNPQVVAQGETIYAQSCASCHGDNLEGEEDWQTRDTEGYLPAPPHDETGHTWHHRDQLLFDLTKYGIQKFAGGDYKTKMPAYEELLSDAEIVAVLSYIKAQWPEKIRTRHDQLNANSE